MTGDFGKTGGVLGEREKALNEIDAILAEDDRQKRALAEIDAVLAEPDAGSFPEKSANPSGGEGIWGAVKDFADDLGNIPEAWRAGNFYSRGGWSDLASTLIDDINPLQSDEGAGKSAARREELYQNYRKWRAENPQPENKTLIGDVVTGAAGLVPLFVDMNIEAAAPALATAGISAGIGAAAGGAGVVPAGVAGGLLGYKASMATQSGKVALADIYTSLRDEGFDDATSAAWAYRLAVPYGALEYAGRALAPVSRLALGSGGLRGVIDKIADKGVKNKILNYAAKAGMDVAATGIVESAVEAAQAAMVELARQGAGGEKFDAGKMAQAAAEEFKDAAPAMYGMALLGIVPQAGARRVIERVKSGGGERNAPAAPENAAEPFGGSAAAEAGQQAAGAGGAGVWGSPEAGGQGGLQFGEAGGRPQADYFIYGADGKLVGTSREPPIPPTVEGVYYDSYASAFADAGRRGIVPTFADGGRAYSILPVESGGRVFYYAAEYDPQSGRRNVELLENVGGVAGPEWLGEQMGAFIERRRNNPDAGPMPGASAPFVGADGVENAPINFARERVGRENDEALSAAEAVENSQKNSRRKVRYEELDDFLENGIVPGESSFYDFGELSPETVERIKSATGKDLSGYVHALDSFGVLHGENSHGGAGERLRGQVPINRQDWKLADEIVQNFDGVEIRKKGSSVGNDILIFNKKIGDTVYYVAEVRAGRKKLVSATMWKRKIRDGNPDQQSKWPADNVQNAPESAVLNTESENASESQGENLNFSADEEAYRAVYGQKAQTYRPADRRQGIIGFETSEGAEEAKSFWRAVSDAAERRAKGFPAIAAKFRIPPLPKGVSRRKDGRLEGFASIADIRRWAERAFDVPIKKALDTRKEKMAAGAFYRQLELIRTRGGFHNDAEVIFHEIGHYLDGLFFEGRLSRGNAEDSRAKALKRELERFCVSRFGDAYPPPLRASEGWAQFLSEYLRDPAAVSAEAPIASNVLKILKDDFPQIGKLLDDAAEMLALNAGADPTARIAGQIRPSAEPVSRTKMSLIEMYDATMARVRELFFDDKAAIAELQDRLNEHLPTSEAAVFADMMNNWRGGARGQSEYSVLTEQIDLDGVPVGKSLLKIFEPLSEEERSQMGALLVSRRAIGYFERNRDLDPDTMCRRMFGFSISDARAVAESASKNMRIAATEVESFNRNALKMLLDGGVIGAGEFEKMAAVPNYVPLRRVMEEAENAGRGGGISRGVKRFTGSDREIVDPIASMVENEAVYREIALKNRIKRDIVETVGKIKGGGRILSPYKDAAKAVRISRKELAEALSKTEFGRKMLAGTGVDWSDSESVQRAIAAQLDFPDGILPVIWKRRAEADARNLVLTYFDGGDARAVQLEDPYLYRAIASMDQASANLFTGVFGKFLTLSAAAVRAGATKYVDFVVSNFSRDMQTLYIYTRNDANPRHLAMGMKAAALGSKSELFRDWARSGGRYGGFVGSSAQIGGNLYERLRGGGIRGTVADLKADFARGGGLRAAARLARAPKKAIDALTAMAEAAENAVRLAEFAAAREKAIKNGADWENDPIARMFAANDSKEVTVNFSRHGTLGGIWSSAVPFFNAGLQGSRKQAEKSPINLRPLLLAISEGSAPDWKKVYNKNGAVRAVKSALLTSISVAACLGLRALFDDDDPLDRPTWERCRYICFPGGWRVPVSLEIMPEWILANYMMDKMIKPREESDFNLGKAFVEQIPSVFPVPVAFLSEAWAGYSIFLDAPIESLYDKRLRPQFRAHASTSKTALWVSQVAADGGAELSPILVDSFINNFGASLGRALVRYGADPVVGALAGAPQSPSQGVKDIPGLGAFASSPFSPNVYVERFAREASLMDSLIATANANAAGKTPAARFTESEKRRLEFYNKTQVELDQNGNYVERKKSYFVRKARERISEMNNEIRRIRYDEKLSAKAKKEEISRLVRYRNDLAKDACRNLTYRGGRKD